MSIWVFITAVYADLVTQSQGLSDVAVRELNLFRRLVMPKI